MKNALRVISLTTLVLLPATLYAFPLLLVTIPLFLATITLTLLATAQRRQYAWLWATIGIGGLGIIVPGFLGPIVQSAVNQSLAPCMDQRGSAACPQSAGQTLLVNGLKDLLLLGLVLIILLAFVYSFRMRPDTTPRPPMPMRTPTPA